MKSALSVIASYKMNKTQLLAELKKYGSPKPPSDLRKDELVLYTQAAERVYKKDGKYDQKVSRQKALDYTPSKY